SRPKSASSSRKSLSERDSVAAGTSLPLSVARLTVHPGSDVDASTNARPRPSTRIALGSESRCDASDVVQRGACPRCEIGKAGFSDVGGPDFPPPLSNRMSAAAITQIATTAIPTMMGLRVFDAVIVVIGQADANVRVFLPELG